ncbi:MAG: hypothetical protein ACPGRG_11340 [Marinomonas sp.]|jgi:NAD/NADP transhydrogenase beta subunit|uniref:Uncharacterized protein n=1 Tax=Marinomonas pontica TaxID=264739 RepID=A0ABN6WIZ1_9GAMM|nr:hypothetical protein [Marinomonas pontica]MCW8354547.1 hypothetical protein [Marinomonas pontica]BDX01809.1 hypothetical protein MACH16_05570 [Marinomonas pontica]
MVASPKLMSLIESLLRIILTIVFFYAFKAAFEVENDLLLAFFSVLCAFITFKGLILAFNKLTAKK